MRYSFQLVTEAFCDLFLEEVFNFYKSRLPPKAFGGLVNGVVP